VVIITRGGGGGGGDVPLDLDVKPKNKPELPPSASEKPVVTNVITPTEGEKVSNTNVVTHSEKPVINPSDKTEQPPSASEKPVVTNVITPTEAEEVEKIKFREPRKFFQGNEFNLLKLLGHQEGGPRVKYIKNFIDSLDIGPVRDDYPLMSTSDFLDLPCIKEEFIKGSGIEGVYFYYSGPTSNIYKAYKCLYGTQLLIDLRLDNNEYYKSVVYEFKNHSLYLDQNEFATLLFKKYFGS
jgi:hypothetical protein